MIKLSYRFLKSSALTLIAFVSIAPVILPTNVVLALSDAQKGVFDNGILYFDTDGLSSSPASVCSTTNTDSPGAPTGSTSQSVYILGDSITVRAASAYKQAFQKNGATVIVDGLSSRSLSSTGAASTDGTDPSNRNNDNGMKAIADDKSEITGVSTIVVALGTNGGDTAQSITAAISALRAINSTATIYWIDTFGLSSSDFGQNGMGTANSAINGQSSSQNYSVISWAKAVDPNVDPNNPGGKQTDSNGYISTAPADRGVHPTYDKGVPALANLVASTIANPPNTASSACCSGSTTSSLTGDTNGIRAYNFLVSKGLTPIAAAGAVGNFTEESTGVEPERLQGDYTNRHPAESLSAYQIAGGASGTSVGWGVAQFTPPSKYVTMELDKGTSYATINSLTNQLNYIWSIVSNYESDLNGATTPEDAATRFLADYERGNPNSTRQEYARAYYNLATQGIALPPNVPVSTSDAGSGGTNTTAPPSTDSGCPTTGTGSGGSSGGYSNPFHDMTNLVATRIDEGVDYYAAAGTTVPIYAIGNGVVTQATSQSSFYTTSGGYADWITYQLTDGPAAGKFIYVSEACSPILVKVGDKVTTNTQLCSVLPDSIETGWALDATSQAAAALNDYTSDGYETAYGVNFNQLLVSLGAPAGRLDAGSDPSGQVLGTLPGNWPSWQ